MGSGQRADAVARERQETPLGERLGAVLDGGGQGPAKQQLHDEVGAAVGLADRVDLHEPRVSKLGENRRLATEGARGGDIAGAALTVELQCVLAVAASCSIHDVLRPAPELVEDLEPVDRRGAGDHLRGFRGVRRGHGLVGLRSSLSPRVGQTGATPQSLRVALDEEPGGREVSRRPEGTQRASFFRGVPLALTPAHVVGSGPRGKRGRYPGQRLGLADAIKTGARQPDRGEGC